MAYTPTPLFSLHSTTFTSEPTSQDWLASLLRNLPLTVLKLDSALNTSSFNIIVIIIIIMLHYYRKYHIRSPSHHGGPGSIPGSSVKDLCWTVALGHVSSPLPVVIQPVLHTREAGTKKACLWLHYQGTRNPRIQIIIIMCLLPEIIYNNFVIAFLYHVFG